MKKIYGSLGAIRKFYVIFAAITVIVGGFFVFGNIAQAATLSVDGAMGDDSTGVPDGLPYKTIQAAINAAVDGDTINVAAGDYTEQITINKSIDLIGAGAATASIIAPAVRAGSVTQEAAINDYVLAAYALTGTIDARIEGFTIDVNGQNKTSGTNQIDGVFFRDVKDAGGTVAGLFSSTIHNFAATPDYEGFGIAVYGDSLLTLGNNDISDYTRDGISINRYGGLASNPNVTISGNTITGSAAPLNGINISAVSAGSVTGNTITGNTRSAPWAAGGIVIWGSAGLSVTGNHVNGNFYGIDIEDNSDGVTISGNDLADNIKRAISLNNSSNSTVAANTITGPTSGTDDVAIGIANNSTGNTIGGNAPADGNTITMSSSTAPGVGNLYAIHMDGTMGSGSNTIKYNTIVGGRRGVQFDGPPGATGITTVANNTISGQEFGGITAYNNGDLVISDNTLTDTVRPLEFFGPVNLTISGNIINGSVYAGINLGNFSGTANINHNTVFNVPAGNNGIFAQAGGTGLSIHGNIIHDIGERGIQINASAVNANIDGNEIYAVTGYAGIIVDTGATGAKINNNYIHNNNSGGAAINAQTAEFNGNTVIDNDFGVEMGDAGAAFVLRNNVITGNDSAGTACANPKYGVCAGNLSVYNGAADAANNYWGTSSSTEIAAKVSNNVTYQPWSNGLASETSISVDAPEVIIGSNAASSTSAINVPADVLDAKLNVSGLLDSGTMSATLPGAITINAITSIGNVNVQIPADIQITGATGWTGIVNVPQIKSNSSVTPVASLGNNASVSSVIEIGFDDVKLTFDKAVRILIAGQAGKYVGYSRSGAFHQITNVCLGDSQSVGDALLAEGDCKIDVGSDLVIWTKHFTSFATYTQSLAPSTSYSSGGGGGGGGGGGTPAPVATAPAPIVTANAPVATALVTASSETSAGQVLGASTFNFSSNLGIGSSGEAVTELQKRLTVEGVYSGPVTGYFGNLTFAGVKAYQAKYGISQVGNVGPLTRAQLNGGQVAGASTINIEAIQAQIAILQAQLDALIKQLKELQ